MLMNATRVQTHPNTDTILEHFSTNCIHLLINVNVLSYFVVM